MTTITYHQIDGAGRPTGVTMTRDAAAGVPLGWVDVAPPSAGPGEAAEWRGAAWVLVAADLEAERLAAARAAKVAAIDRQRDLVLAAGAPYGAARIAVHDGARADMSGMAAYATTVMITAATAAPVAWPASYALGWIAADNSRVPLPTAADGLALAAAVGAWYGAVVQRARDLKDAALGAPDIAALDAIDVGAGWP